MIAYEEIKKKAHRALNEGEVTLVLSRVCSAPDQEGVSKILRDNPSVSLIHLLRVSMWSDEMTESYYSINDEILAKECRKVLEEEWLKS